LKKGGTHLNLLREKCRKFDIRIRRRILHSSYHITASRRGKASGGGDEGIEIKYKNRR
jgi:hypothetical protein